MLFTVFRKWQFWVMAALVLMLAAGWGFAFYNFDVGQHNAAAVAELRGSKADLEDRLDAATRERDALAANRSSVENAARQREDAAKRREDEVRKREDAIKIREDTVAAHERIEAQNTIGEGNWAVGVDIQPGTYRTKDTVSGTCYWEINSDPNGDDILANDIVDGGRPTVTLKNGQFFKTSRCGEWIKV